MLRQYTPLAAFSLASYAASTLVRPAPNPVTLNSPAIDVMTDLSQIAAVTIEGSALLASANEYMAARGVRSLFVATPEGRVSGLITAADVLGERPVRVGHARGVGRNELQVADVMTPIDAVVAMKLEDVRAAKVGHVVASLKHAGRQHGLVAEIRSPSEVAIRGIFSATQIARQLGVPLQIPELASTFSEVEQALSAPR
jgi:signal-transduction protein with cAMP-binding, CBS, and nucleotidyltransferase domain